MIDRNIKTVRSKIDETLERSGRLPGSVRLLVVTKTVPKELVLKAIKSGTKEFGENKVQEARSKILELKQSGLTWRMIGHLQKNKVKYIFDLFDRVDSVDSSELAEAIHLVACKRGVIMPILDQVNVAQEEAKFGVDPNKLEAMLRNISDMNGIRVEGLMTITPFDPNPENARPYYAKLREIRDRMESLKISNINLHELSMGMTNDYSVAIEDGATIVRIGTAIFGTREF